MSLTLSKFSLVCMCVCVLYKMSDVSDPNLCPRMLWTPVFPRKILQDSPVQCRPDLLDPKGFLLLAFCLSHILLLSPSLTHTHIYRHTDNHHDRPQREKERNGSCHFSSFNWSSAAFSVIEPLRGGHPTKGEPFTLYCLLPQRAHISFLTLSLHLPSFSHFSHIPSIHHLYHFSSVSVHLFPYLYFITYGLTMPFEYASLSKILKGRGGEKWGQSIEEGRDCRAANKHIELEGKELDRCLKPNSSLSDQRDV